MLNIQPCLTEVQVTPKPLHRLTVQIDELWSFVNDKDQEQWVWLAMDASTREIVGCYIGDRSGKSAQALWDSLPAVYPRVFGGKLPHETLDASVQCVTRISGHLIQLFYLANDIGQSAKTLERRAILSDSIAPLGNECHGWFGKPYRSRRS